MHGMWEYIKYNLEKSKNSTIKEDKDSETYKYIELLNEVEGIGDNSDLSVLKGAKCAILCKRNIETIKALFFCWRTAMIAIPLSLHYGMKHCSDIIDLIEPDFILSDDLSLCKEFEGTIFLTLNKINLLDEIHFEKDGMLRDIELMMCTSGTTGTPKAIMFSTEAIIKNTALISDYFTVDNTDTMLICRPIYHCAVLVGELLLSILVGANIVLYSGGYDPFIIANILRGNDITVMCGTPTILKGLSACLKHRHEMGNLKTIALSGEYLLPEYARDIREVFPCARIFNVYGLTEAGPRVTYLPFDMFDDIPQSVGQPLEGIEILISDENGGRKEFTQVGEVWIKTPTIMSGYYKNSVMSKQKFCGEWFRTGDIGILDERNNLYILGRSDDMIIKAGMNIYPQEVEKSILDIKEIREVLVYGEIVNGVEQIIADVVLEKNCEIETNYEISLKISQILPDYMMPLRVTIVKELPRNASGKLIRPSKKVRNYYDSM